MQGESVSQPSDQISPEGERIQPIEFHTPGSYRTFWNKKLFGLLAGTTAVLILFLLCSGAWFVFTARQVSIQIDPPPDEMKIKGGIATPRVGSHFLMQPGSYELVAHKTCFQELSHQFKVNDAKSQQVQLVMEKLPGKLQVNAHQEDKPQQAVIDASVRIDGTDVGRTPLPAFEIDAGDHRLEIIAENFKIRAHDFIIEGCEKLQALDLALIPGWSSLTISSIPSGAKVSVNGTLKGSTPAQLDLNEGTFDLTLMADGYKPWKRKIEIKANTPIKLENIELKPADGRLTVTSMPSGATVKLGRRKIGTTPITAGIPPDVEHLISIAKPGYAQVKHSVRLKSAESKTLKITLEPQTGIIRIDISPPDAELWIDGVRRKFSDKRLTLSTIEHQLEIKKKGFVSYRKKILPRSGKPIDLKIALKPIGPPETSSAKFSKAPNGYPLRLVSPSPFTMGSSRREQGRRSNETIRSVNLSRPYYIGTREVTNREFRQFLASHRSGEHKGQSLDDNDKPVVFVSWEQAALFCNWLSTRASLPPVYIEKNGRLTATDQIGPGYRLPTEAEWAYVARMTSAPSTSGIKFPWGKGYPPPQGSGNFADASAKDMLPSYIETYNDGYPLTAPPGKFKPNKMGLHDLSGNVAEWCHDYYQIYQPGKKFVDPTGPVEGRHHVVRGSSWKHGSISTLRMAYRDYSDSKRTDLGFRIARYVE